MHVEAFSSTGKNAEYENNRNNLSQLFNAERGRGYGKSTVMIIEMRRKSQNSSNGALGRTKRGFGEKEKEKLSFAKNVFGKTLA